MHHMSSPRHHQAVSHVACDDSDDSSCKVNSNGIVAWAGTGGNPSLGEQAAEESSATIAAAVGNADMVRPPYC